jgi:hypothetical protein
MIRIATAFLLASSIAIAAQEPRTVAERALVAWSAHDARSLSTLAHPELIRRIRDARLINFYVAGKPDKKGILVSGSDAEVLALFCEALQAIVPPRDARVEYFDHYIETKAEGDRATVIFDSGWKRRSDGAVGDEFKQEVILKKSGDEWKFLWSPAVSIHVDLTWDPKA